MMANFSRNMSWTIVSDEVLWSFRPYKLWLWQHVVRETENLNTEFKGRCFIIIFGLTCVGHGEYKTWVTLIIHRSLLDSESFLCCLSVSKKGHFICRVLWTLCSNFTPENSACICYTHTSSYIQTPPFTIFLVLHQCKFNCRIHAT
jgi:hypothetical protein